ncbi:helix-turn-helix domain-containing protein [Methanimicrococcus stummii]|nr:helix-turn-helix domain-containing protein [Methanimicrococcus sp. Es2]
MNLSTSQRLMKAAFESDENFQIVLHRVIKEDLNMSAIDFAEEAGIPHSTLYKILTGNRTPNIKTLRQIVLAVRMHERPSDEFIAVIAARMVLDTITETKRKIGGRLITVKEYSANSIEEAIIVATRAERDGAKALVCAPIVSHTVEKIVSIPVTTIMPKESITEAIEIAMRKIG